MVKKGGAFTNGGIAFKYYSTLHSNDQSCSTHWLSNDRSSRSTLGSTASPPEMSSFEERMRLLVNTQQAKETSRALRKSSKPSNLLIIKTLEDYDKALKSADNKLVVVRFYAEWCKACKAIAPSFYRLANIYENVIFIDVPVTEKNANLHQGLEVPSLPYGHIYHPTGGLVEEMKMSKKFFPQFARTLVTYVEGLCDIEEEDTDS